ncbi:MAG: hypothetical protein HQL23_00860 [Candidatus Omnitrophica bacterium]|nr:hypothetical protein [Candidatus Omnitrophota bacterium]
MRHGFILTTFLIFALVAQPVAAQIEYPHIYNYFFQSGLNAYAQQDYDTAFNFFQQAHLIAPQEERPLLYISLIEKAREDRGSGPQAAAVTPVVPEPDAVPAQYVVPAREIVPVPDVDQAAREQAMQKALEQLENAATAAEKNAVVPSPMPVMPHTVALPPQVLPVESPKVPLPKVTPAKKTSAPTRYARLKHTEQRNGQNKVIPPLYDNNTLYLDDKLAATQPKTTLKVFFHDFVILQGKNIERFLVTAPDLLGIERLNRDQLKVSGLRRGKTYLHVWDGQRRWTFDTEVILPYQLLPPASTTEVLETQNKPLHVMYTLTSGSTYGGKKFDEMTRQNLSLLQWIGIADETPYGDFDGSLTYNKFPDSTELTGYGIGLMNGHIGDFNDFSMRGFDTSKSFSPLTLPGQSYRGFLLDAMAFDKQVAYSYVSGQNQATYGMSSTGSQILSQAFIEGFKTTFFPLRENNMSFNFARGWGSGRAEDLKERVYSVQGQRRISDIFYTGEYAYDDHEGALLLGGAYQDKQNRWNLNFRDTAKDFKTITGNGPSQGQTGVTWSDNHILNDATVFSSYADVYHDGISPNDKHPDFWNLDFNTNLSQRLSETSNLYHNLSFVYTPGEVSPVNNFLIGSTYGKSFPIWNKQNLGTSAGLTYQRSRYDRNFSSDYDRYSFSTGLNLPLFAELSYFMNYQISFVDSIGLKEMSYPYVWNYGLNAFHRFTDTLSGNASLTYRNEERTEKANSFLSGEDSLSGSLGATFNPAPDWEFYLNGYARNVWAENALREPSKSVDIRAGVRLGWDTPISWSPLGTVKGVVYKDLNGDQIQNVGEPGIANVAVKVGEQTVKTNAQGVYERKVFAEKVRVAIDGNSIPSGFVFTTPLYVDVNIVAHKVQRVNFGVNAQSGIYGMVYFDKNGNGRPDEGDVFPARVKIVLNGKISEFTDSDGSFFFRNLPVGKYQMTIDINSLPSGYLPAIKISNEIALAEGATYVFHIPLKKVESGEKKTTAP